MSFHCPELKIVLDLDHVHVHGFTVVALPL